MKKYIVMWKPIEKFCLIYNRKTESLTLNLALTKCRGDTSASIMFTNFKFHTYIEYTYRIM